MPPWLILALKIAANVAAILLGIWLLWPALRPPSASAPRGRAVDERARAAEPAPEGTRDEDAPPRQRERSTYDRAVGE